MGLERWRLDTTPHLLRRWLLEAKSWFFRKRTDSKGPKKFFPSCWLPVRQRRSGPVRHLGGGAKNGAIEPARQPRFRPFPPTVTPVGTMKGAGQARLVWLNSRRGRSSPQKAHSFLIRCKYKSSRRRCRRSEAVAIIWAEGNAPRDDLILGGDMAPGVIERTRSISRQIEHHRRPELLLIDWACFGLCRWKCGGYRRNSYVAGRSAIRRKWREWERHCRLFRINYLGAA